MLKSPIRNYILLPEQPLLLVQLSFANENLMKARLGFAWVVTVVIE
jgi:hypothetical protein